jgi:hypothetical protein
MAQNRRGRSRARPDDPLAAARRLRTTTFFGAFELDPAGSSAATASRSCAGAAGRRQLLLADA